MSSVANQDGVVYLLTSPSGKQYVGQSWCYEKRMRDYRCASGRKGKSAIYDALCYYRGLDNFASTIIAQGIQTQEALDATEDAFIMLLNTMSPHGYNLKRGGSYGKLSSETINKIRASQLGKHHSRETRDKISVSKRNPSTETRDKMRASHLGKHHSRATRDKMSATHSAFRNANIDRVMAMLASGKTQREVAEEIGVDKRTICRWVKLSNGLQI